MQDPWIDPDFAEQARSIVANPLASGRKGGKGLDLWI